MGLHIQQRSDTKTNINAIGAGNYKARHIYFSTDTHEFAYGLSNNNLSAWMDPSNLGTTYTFTDTATVDFTNSSGTITAAVKLSATAGNAISANGDGIWAQAISVAAGSANYLQLSAGELSVKSLLVSSVSVDNTETSLSAYLTTSGYATAPHDEFQRGDYIILTAATGGQQVWIHHGGTAGTTADFTQVEKPEVTDAYIRALLSGTAPVTYNSSTGAIGLAFASGIENDGGTLKLGGALTRATTFTGNFDFSLNIGASNKLIVGGTSGASKITAVTGDIEVVEDAKGYILRSPNATRWRVTIDNDGTLTTTSL